VKVLEGRGDLSSGQGWRHWPGLGRLGAGLDFLQPARTRAMLLVAFFGASAGAAIELYGAPVAILFCLLMAASCLVPLRARALPSIMLAAVAAAALALGRLASEGPGASWLWAGLAAGSALLLGSTLLALGTSHALARTAAGAGGRRDRRGVESAGSVLSSEAGLKRAAWELARAAHYRRQVTLCLFGLDAGGMEHATPMRRVDRFLLRQLSGFEVVAEHGATRRLLVLPEVWADGFGEEAQRLCRLAGQRAGRPVRAAMVTFPFHGTRIEDLLNELEVALEMRGPSSDQASESSQATGFAS
jgi:hypothetical protein